MVLHLVTLAWLEDFPRFKAKRSTKNSVERGREPARKWEGSPLLFLKDQTNHTDWTICNILP